MLSSASALRDLLRATPYPDAEHFTVALPGANAPVHAVKVDNRSSLPLWQACCERLQGSGYYPIVTCFWGGWRFDWRESAESELIEASGRFFFREEVDRRLAGMNSTAPSAIVAASGHVSYKDAIHDYLSRIRVTGRDIAWEIERLTEMYGIGPTQETLELAILDETTPPAVAYRRAAFEWERARGIRPPFNRPVSWYEPEEPMALVLLPVEYPEHVLAYFHWWGSSVLGSPATIALLASWRERFGARLACHFGTMLQFYVDRPPQDEDAAFALAVELETVAPSNCMGEIAWHLLDTNRWFLHNRP